LHINLLCNQHPPQHSRCFLLPPLLLSSPTAPLSWPRPLRLTPRPQQPPLPLRRQPRPRPG
jgi:hypothetical protein